MDWISLMEFSEWKLMDIWFSFLFAFYIFFFRSISTSFEHIALRCLALHPAPIHIIQSPNISNLFDRKLLRKLFMLFEIPWVEVNWCSSSRFIFLVLQNCIDLVESILVFGFVQIEFVAFEWIIKRFLRNMSRRR